jgi:hypothetical protein
MRGAATRQAATGATKGATAKSLPRPRQRSEEVARRRADDRRRGGDDEMRELRRREEQQPRRQQRSREADRRRDGDELEIRAELTRRREEEARTTRRSGDAQSPSRTRVGRRMEETKERQRAEPIAHASRAARGGNGKAVPIASASRAALMSEMKIEPAEPIAHASRAADGSWGLEDVAGMEPTAVPIACASRAAVGGNGQATAGAAVPIATASRAAVADDAGSARMTIETLAAQVATLQETIAKQGQRDQEAALDPDAEVQDVVDEMLLRACVHSEKKTRVVTMATERLKMVRRQEQQQLQLAPPQKPMKKVQSTR